MSLFEVSVAIAMLSLVAALLAWFFRWKADGSLRRRNAMMAELGVDRATLQTSEAMNDVRKRCSRCRSEAECERWLAGQGVGDFSGTRFRHLGAFCPNARTFASWALSASWEDSTSGLFGQPAPLAKGG